MYVRLMIIIKQLLGNKNICNRYSNVFKIHMIAVMKIHNDIVILIH